MEASKIDPRWKELYRIGFIANVAFPVVIALAILAYFIWPYAPGTTGVADIFASLQTDRIGGLASLDGTIPFLLPVMILEMLALYVALKQVNESYALIALVLGIMGIVLWLSSKPLVEMVYLSDRYAAAQTDLERNHYLAAGEALHAVFSGTSWMLSQFLISISGITSCLLMLRCNYFSRATAYLGIALGILGISFWIPVIGVILSLFSTISGVIWYVLMARGFYRMGWGKTTSAVLVNEPV